MRVLTYASAMRLARANAQVFNVAYGVFSDTTGMWNVERWSAWMEKTNTIAGVGKPEKVLPPSKESTP